jgi:hypothetical protein
MPIKIIDEVQYNLYDTLLATAKKDISVTEQLLEDLIYEANRLAEERKKYYVEVLGSSPTYSHSVELIDKFISDHNFNGSWPNKWRCERYFYYDEKSNSWDCYGNMPNVVYYREVELRYAELKLEGKVNACITEH